MQLRSRTAASGVIWVRLFPTLLGWLLVLGVSDVLAEDWPHWRGPSRNDHVSVASGWDGTRWNLQKAWQVRVGEGASSPLLVDDRVYIMGWLDGKDVLHCLDADSGKPIWKQSYPAPRYARHATGDQGLYSGITSTPEYDTDTHLLYSLSNDGDLCCWDTRRQGQRVWQLNLYDLYDAPQRPRVNRSGRRDYGYTSSPLVQGEQLIVEVGGNKGTLAGFDKRSGKPLWHSQANYPAGHNGGPVPMTVDGVACVAVHHFDGLLVARIDPGHEGRTVAEYPWRTDFGNNIATPAVQENNVVLTSSYNHHRIARLQISLANGAKKVWEQDAASKVCSPVIHDGHVYWAWKQVYCLDFETGRVVWKGGRLGDAGSLIVTSDDRLVAWVSDGDLRLINTAGQAPNQYELVAELKGLGESDAWPHLALANGRLLCKDRKGLLLCFTVGK